jgi:hypothetical protein
MPQCARPERRKRWNAMTKRLRGRARERGATFVMAIVSLVVMLILGTSFIGRTINALYQAKNTRDDMAALAISESGVDMIICMLYDNYGSIGSQLQSSGQYQKTFSMPRGTCDVHVSTNYGGIPEALRIESTGTTSTNVQARVEVIAKAITDVSRVFRGAIFSNSPMTLNGAGSVLPDSSGQGGDIYSNGDITFSGTFTRLVRPTGCRPRSRAPTYIRISRPFRCR